MKTHFYIRRITLIICALSLAACASVPDLSQQRDETASHAVTDAQRQSNISAVREVLNSLQTGQPAAIERHVSPLRYVQHNHRIPDGRDALLAALPGMAKAGSQVKIIRAFADGNFVVTHSQYQLYGQSLIGFDVFRFDNGQIVEHWDNLSPVRPLNPSGRSMIDGSAEVVDRHLTRQNKAVVAELMAKGFFGGDVDTVMGLIVDPYYQHNPGVADGIKGLQAAMKGELARYDYKRVVRILGEGNFVVTISEILYDGKPAANYDLFRLENGKVIEHWDLYEHIAPVSEWKNTNGKF